MFELGCLLDSARRLLPVEPFVAIGCEKTGSPLRQQVQSEYALRGRTLLQCKQHLFAQTFSTTLITHHHGAKQHVGSRTLQPSKSHPFPRHFETVKLPVWFTDIVAGQIRSGQRITELIQTVIVYFNHLHVQHRYLPPAYTNRSIF